MSRVYALIGFPGVGKLTIAKALADRIESGGRTVRLVDNHSINNVIFRLVDQDGISPLPDGTWDRVGDVAHVVYDTLETLTPTDWDLIFTVYLDGVTDTWWIPRVTAIADARGADFVPVRVVCDTEENARRIVNEDRVAMMKSIDPNEPARLAAIGEPYDPPDVRSLTVDSTDTPPDRTAAEILRYADDITGRPERRGG